jgi:transposase
MSVNRRKYDTEFKKNAVKLSYASPKTVKEVAEDLGVSESMLYRWRQRYTAQGD